MDAQEANWIQARLKQGWTFEQIKDRLTGKYKYSLQESQDLIDEYRRLTEKKQPSKQNRSPLTIRLSPQEKELIGTTNPRMFIHKLFEESIKNREANA
jgi:hypothetical protein